MKYKIITDNEVRGLPAADQYFRYADAYLQAALRQCDFVAGSPQHGRWPDATVTLFLAAHAMELFFKGAILLRDPDANPVSASHDISELHRRFRNHYPEPEFDWDVPFSTVDLDQDVPSAIKSERAIQSMVHRYPVDRKLASWSQLNAMEPTTFKAVLIEWQENFLQLQSSCQKG